MPLFEQATQITYLFFILDYYKHRCSNKQAIIEKDFQVKPCLENIILLSYEK